MRCRGRPGTSARRSPCGAWTADRIWCCRCSARRTSATCSASAVDFYTTPPAHLVPGATGWWITVGTYVVSGIDLRSRNIETLDQIKDHALDYYAQFRSIARQHRDGQIRAARGLAESPDDLVDPGAPAQ